MRKRLAGVVLGVIMSCATVFGQSYQQVKDGVIIRGPQSENGIASLKLVVRSPRVIQVISSPNATFSDRKSWIIDEASTATSGWKIEESETHVKLVTSKIAAWVNKQNKQVTFFDATGKLILQEAGKSVAAARVLDEDCYHIKQAFNHQPQETLYGLGSFQDERMTLNGRKIYLLQTNREDMVPVVLSSNKYGLLWENYSYSEFKDTAGQYEIWSEVADEINYYFIHGEQLDSIVSSYRTLTGKAPMYPKWVFGYMQSKQRYKNQKEIVATAREFRERKFPIDLIVQDWRYWLPLSYGQKSFDRTRFPNATKMVKDIHALDMKIMISIWPNMTGFSANRSQLERKGGLLRDHRLLDVYNPKARELYWKQTDKGLYSKGIDAFWADCSEGDDSDWGVSARVEPTAEQAAKIHGNNLKKIMGSGRNINVYPLLHTKGIYEGQIAGGRQARPFTLTRSSFAGMQKYGASYWTGDVSASWKEFRMQIPSGLNFCMTGIPYWTTDIAGYFVFKNPGMWFARGEFQQGLKDEGFKELYTRWFQFAAFCPLFRAHGMDVPREPWQFGSPDSRTYKTLLKFTNLRYRLMPYIYSTGWKVTDENYTMMRALPFDFMEDVNTRNINDQYMFGSSFLVSPVVEANYFLPDNVKVEATEEPTRDVYLPSGVKWWDFWTGKALEGGQHIKADAAYETMPLFVKGGSIVPMGPFVQYATQSIDSIEVRVYAGADGTFTLYEDENDNFNYQKGMYSLIEFQWNDAKNQLTIAARKGSFPGMRTTHTFNIIKVGANKGVGVEVSDAFDKVVEYDGNQVVVEL
ncbi:glycoside hydrolase family 31 protein [Bacteroidota bacterium]